MKIRGSSESETIAHIYFNKDIIICMKKSKANDQTQWIHKLIAKLTAYQQKLRQYHKHNLQSGIKIKSFYTVNLLESRSNLNALQMS